MSENQNAMQAARRPFKDYAARHFRFEASEDGRVATDPRSTGPSARTR